MAARTAPAPAAALSFREFYYEHFLNEHTHPVNIALHVVGTIASLLFLGLVYENPWLLPLYPVVHAAPGLVGHKIFEPNHAAGDLRIFRTDFPGIWFLFGNHVMTFRLLTCQPRRPGDLDFRRASDDDPK